MLGTNQEPLHLPTVCIHAGRAVDTDTKAIARPIVLSNSYRLKDSMEGIPDSFDWNQPHAFNYPRWNHPNAKYLEERLAAIEGAEDCVVFASGVAAMAGLFFTSLGAGDHLVCSRVCYVGVHDLLVNHLAKRFGVEVSLVNTWDLAAVRKAVRKNTRLIHVETPANPNTMVSDISAVADVAHEVGARLSVDSTYSGMVTQAPLGLGADLVMHSISKYVNGHGDGLGGAVLGRKDLIMQIRQAASIHLGATISPFNAWLIMRSTETLPLRMRMHCENGLAIAEFLESHPKVKFVRYPGLKSHPQYSIARKQMTGFSGMLNFGLKAPKSAWFDFLKRLGIITHAVCLGHTESLIQFYPQEGDHPELGVLNYPEDIGEGFLRLSVGLEDPEDLKADLQQALEAV